jgi:fatty acid desaturase
MNTQLELQAICFSKRGRRIAKIQALTFWAKLIFAAVVILWGTIADFKTIGAAILIVFGITFYFLVAVIIILEDEPKNYEFWLKKTKPTQEEMNQWTAHKQSEKN